MPPSLSSWLGSTLRTSQLEAPTEIQRSIDFLSERTVASDEATYLSANTSDINWERMRGYERPIPPLKKQRATTSFIWRYGWRLYKPSDGLDYWVCRLCHNSPTKPRSPKNFAYVCTKATSSAMAHLERVHALGSTGVVTPRRQPSTPSQPSVIESYCAGASERNRAAETFDDEVFKGLLTRLFAVEQLPYLKVESESFKDLLIYCNPRCKNSLPSRNTLRSYTASAYEHSLAAVESELARARININLSFDLWTSPGRRLSLLDVVAHYLDDQFKPRTVLLALPQMKGSHTAVNLSLQLASILDHFKLRESFGYAVTDNASENRACLNLLAKELGIDAGKRHVLCMGHIINLVAHKVLFGSDVEAFELELESNVTTDVVELLSWRRKGPIGKLHNLIKYITHSAERQDAFINLQIAAADALHDAERDCASSHQQPLHLINDNVTRWNSWYDAAERAILLRQFIEEFTDDELGDYRAKLARFEARSRTSTAIQKPPTPPSIFDDKLTPDDWDVITNYMTILKPCKIATMKLQGNVTNNPKGGAVHGAIWQVLPVFEDLLKGFEEAKQRCLPTEAPLSPPTIQPTARQTNTRRSLRAPVGKASASATTTAMSPGSDIATPASQSLVVDDFAQSQINADFTTLERHFSTNINAAWLKLNTYYTLTDATPIYRAAVFLHPRLKWRWFERYWETKPTWIAAARKAVALYWDEYKHEDSAANDSTANRTAAETLVDEDDEWSYDDDAAVTDQMKSYENEPHPKLSIKDSPIDYWISKLSIWPQLAQLALDVFSTPAMSDSPERVFSGTGTLLTPSRRTMTGEGVEQTTCLRSWEACGIISLSQGLFNSAVATTTARDEDERSDAQLFMAGCLDALD